MNLLEFLCLLLISFSHQFASFKVVPLIFSINSHKAVPQALPFFIFSPFSLICFSEMKHEGSVSVLV